MLINHLKKACDFFSLDITENFEITCLDGNTLQAVALIHKLGGENGILIFTDYKKISMYLSDIDSLQYGFSVMSEISDRAVFDIEEYAELLIDWGLET